MRVLIACEFSGTVRRAFRERGHDAWSADLLDAEDGSGYHICGDVRLVLDRGWDLMIAHPPCTYLANSGNKHLYLDANRFHYQREAAAFFRELLDAPIPRIAIENPIMRYAEKSVGRKPDQIIQPWMFGHKEMKATCFWLQGLPLLQPTSIVGPPPKDKEERKAWARVHRASPGPDRWKERSRTLAGIAKAMADQWTTPPPLLGENPAEAQRIAVAGRPIRLLKESREFDASRLEATDLFQPARKQRSIF